MRDLAIGDVIHDKVHQNGSPFVEIEKEMDLLYLEMHQSTQEDSSN